jgi:prepilin-type N-terminal cleavage/methylation domain-containing protein
MNFAHRKLGTTGKIARGFTLLEILFVVVIIGLLAALALPMYQGYVARSRAAELALKFDAIRTKIQVAAKSGELASACATLADTVQAGNLHSDYAHMAVNFEPVTGGFTPVLTLCATTAAQGASGVEVAREAHQLLSRNSVISQGAVIADSAVSFSVRLAGESALCKTLPPAGAGKSGCTSGTGPVAPTAASTNTVATTPAVTASQPVVQTVIQPSAQPVAVASQPVASAAVAAASAQVAQQNPSGPKLCPAVTPRPVNREVMHFGSAATGYVVNAGNLNTHGNMQAFSAEVVLAADHMQANNAPGATLMSYASAASGNGFSLWNPASLHVTLAGTEYNTGLNVDNGQSHRLTVSWQSSNGALVLYDNGQQVWRQQGANTYGTLAGNGTLAIGQDLRARSGGMFSFRDGYSGSILSTALANKAVTAAQAASGPLHNVLQANTGLLTDVVMGANGRPIDTTGHASYSAHGDVSVQSAMVSSSVYVDSNCQ